MPALDGADKIITRIVLKTPKASDKSLSNLIGRFLKMKLLMQVLTMVCLGSCLALANSPTISGTSEYFNSPGSGGAMIRIHGRPAAYIYKALQVKEEAVPQEPGYPQDEKIKVSPTLTCRNSATSEAGNVCTFIVPETKDSVQYAAGESDIELGWPEAKDLTFVNISGKSAHLLFDAMLSAGNESVVDDMPSGQIIKNSDWVSCSNEYACVFTVRNLDGATTRK
jgi:hypothetical protein